MYFTTSPPRPRFRPADHPRRAALAFEKEVTGSYSRGASNNFWTKVSFGTALTPRSVSAARVAA